MYQLHKRNVFFDTFIYTIYNLYFHLYTHTIFHVHTNQLLRTNTTISTHNHNEAAQSDEKI